MLKVKKTIYDVLPKNNEPLKLTSDIKRVIQKIEKEKIEKIKQPMIMQNLFNQ